jgi:hypothetical protein
MLKVIAFTLGCLKLLLLVLDVESSCSYSWILKVFTFVLDVEGFCFWMLKVCDFWSFVYLHIF